MRTLVVTVETFNEMLVGLIKSGVIFDAEELSNGKINIIFSGGY